VHRFANVDFAVVSGLQKWIDLLVHIAVYDIHCQYRLLFDERMAALKKIHKKLAAISVIKLNHHKLFQ
jgi:hypothetical protein